jgi:hypothetical protein
MGRWQLRNQEIATLREALRGDPTNLDLANQYWIARAGDRAKGESDLRTGGDVIEAYRAVALSSKEGVEAFANAYKDLFKLSGEAPRSVYFDQPLIRTLEASLPQLSQAGRDNVEWVLRSIEASRSSQ